MFNFGAEIDAKEHLNNMAENENKVNEPEVKEPQAGCTFTQEEMNAIIAGRLNRERSFLSRSCPYHLTVFFPSTCYRHRATFQRSLQKYSVVSPSKQILLSLISRPLEAVY